MTKHSVKRKVSRLGSLSKTDVTPPKKDKDDPGLPKPIETVDPEGNQLVPRCVIVQRDEKGYGLTVSGDNPVFVQSVKEDGAAAKAGVLQGDRIIKVNGTLVTQSNHVEVVKLIKSGSYVALTLLGKPQAPGQRSPGMQQQGFGSFSVSASTTTTPHHHPIHHSVSNMSLGSHKPSSPTERITGPQPVDPEKQQQLSNSKIHTIRMMLEQELDYLEKLRSDFAKSPSEKIRTELGGTQKRCKILEEQLFSLTGIHHDCGTPHSPQTPPLMRSPIDNNKENKGDTVEPPTVPKKRLPHQMSLPAVSVPPNIQTQDASWHHMPYNSDSPDGGKTVPVCSSPPHHSSSQQFPLSHSLENIQRSNTISATPSATSPNTTSWKLSGGPTHSRQRSSPDALLHQTESLRHQHVENLRNVTQDLSRSHSEISGPQKFSTSESFGDGEVTKRRKVEESSSRASSFGPCDSNTNSPRVTPPGTPPPPYNSTENMENAHHPEEEAEHQEETPETSPENQLNIGMPYHGGRSGQQQPIISMEDEDFPSDNELTHAEDHGPFNSLSKLRKHPSHLAVFMHYLISNSEPSSLFFTLITDLYKEGNAKEMKKWAYEIHSTFLVPEAPLRLHNIDESVLDKIGDVLQHDLDKEDILRHVFDKAQKKAQEELNEFLADFRNKRTLGLGVLFGPPDHQLLESIHDKSKELRIIENLLLPSLEQFSEDLENGNEKLCAMASSLATLLYKFYGVKSQQALSVIDRCPTFVAKDKSRIKFLNKGKKVQIVLGHQFFPQHYFNVTYCNHCQTIIWGIGSQGYQCQNCTMNIHKSCVKIVEETCIGALRLNKKDKKNNRMSVLDIIANKTRKPSSNPPSAIERARKNHEELESAQSAAFYLSDSSDSAGDRSVQNSRVERLKHKYETLSEEEKGSQGGSSTGGSSRETTPHNPASPFESSSNNCEGSKRGTSIGRSESLRARREPNRHSFRKRSDPNIPQSKSDAEDTTGSSLQPSASSSSSSSTRSLDSPSNSLEAVHRQTAEVSPTTNSPGGQSNLRRDDSNDSDFEAEADPPNFMQIADWDIVKHLKPKERKRQDVINELFHTERTHVRNLKVLERVFYRPIIQEQILSQEQIKLLFANLEEMLEIHGHFNSLMKKKKQESVIVGDIGDIMLQMFDGQSGENFRKAAATFCKNQSIALEVLKNKQKKDQKLAQFLADAEANSLCRRLQLKDIIPTGMQRLTKYPLLLENLAKYTPPSSEEYANIMRALDCTKENLNYVNQAVKDAENHQRLVDVQKKLDHGPFDKVDHPIAQEFRNLDLTKYKMIYEGPLTWRMNRQKVIDLHVLLLENMLILLQKQDDKYILKFHKEETKVTHSPIIKLGNLLIRNVATDKKALFLVSTSTVGPQIYELVAISSAERKAWFRHITEASDGFKTKDGKTKRAEQPPHHPTEKVDSTEETPEEADKNKENIESQESQDTTEGGETSDAGENTSDAGEVSESTSTTKIPAGATSEGEESEEGAVPSKEASSPLTLPSPIAVASGGGVSPSTQSPAPQRRFQQVEFFQIAEGPTLIEPSEVVVSQGAILQTAEPVLTPLEKLRRKDAIIRQELQEKQALIADVLHIPREEFEHVADIANDAEGDKDAKELVLAALMQAKRLTELINESQTITEEDAVTASAEVEDSATPQVAAAPSPKPSRKANKMPAVPVDKLLNISNTLTSHLTQLLAQVSERDEERERLRKELRYSREQIHQLHEARRRTPVSQSPSNSVSHSRPNSYISVTSSTSEFCEPGECMQQLEDISGFQISPLPAEVQKTTPSESCDSEPLPIATNDEGASCDDGTTEAFVDVPSQENPDPTPIDPPAPTLPNVEIEINVDDGDIQVTAESSSEVTSDNAENPMYGAIF